MENAIVEVASDFAKAGIPLDDNRLHRMLLLFKNATCIRKSFIDSIVGDKKLVRDILLSMILKGYANDIGGHGWKGAGRLVGALSNDFDQRTQRFRTLDALIAEAKKGGRKSGQHVPKG